MLPGLRIAASSAGAGLVVLVAVLAPSPGRAQCPVFYTVSPIPTGPNPHDVLAGDFNEDGALDLAVAIAGSHEVAILRGLGSGVFDTPVRFPAGPSPFCLTSGDFDEDGILDLVVGNIGTNKVAVLRGLGTGGIGDGMFAAPAFFTAGSNPFRIATGDFNGDGIIDLAVVNNGSASLSILLGGGSGGVGNGTFGPPTEYPTGMWPSGVVAADLNGDLALDVAVSNNGPSNVSVLFGNGDGTFDPAINHATGGSPFNLAFSDFNQDGVIDLVTACAHSGTASVLLGLGGGAFASNVNYTSGANSSGLALADVDVDGITDILVSAASEHKLTILRGQGSSGVGNGTFGPCTSYAVGDVALAVAVGDFNDDGIPDAATANYGAAGISVLVSGQPPVSPVTISGSSPAFGLDTTSVQPMVVTGTQFETGATVQLSRGSSTRSATNVIVDPTGTSLTADFDLRGAERGLWTLRVTNPDGRFGLRLLAFRVDPVPVPQAIEPTTNADIQVQPVTVTGTRFDPAAQLSLFRDDGETIEAMGEEVTSGGTVLSGTLDLRNHTPGPWHVKVRNGPGTASGILPSAFVVQGLRVTAIVPPATNPRTLVATVRGSGFQSGAHVLLEQTGLPTVHGSEEAPSADSTEIAVRFDLRGQAAGLRNVTVTNPNGFSATLVNGLEVLPGPEITSVSPAFAADTGAVLLTVGGDRFSSGATVHLSLGSSTLMALNVIVDSSGTSLTADFDLRGAQHGLWTLGVSNPDSSLASRPQAFRIDWVPVPQAILPTTGPDTQHHRVTVTGTRFDPGAQLSLFRDGGETIEATSETVASGGTELSGTLDLTNRALGPWHVRVRNSFNTASDTLSNAFLVVQGPRISGFTPSSADVVSVLDATVHGSGFQSGAQVLLEWSGGPTVHGTEEVASPDGTEITVRFNLSGQSAGFRNVTVTNPDGFSATLVNGLEVLPGPVLTFVSPGFAPDTGVVLLTLGGQRFASGAQTWLRRAGQPNIVGTVLSVSPQGTLVHATYDLEGQALGFWDVVIENSSLIQAELPEAFEIRPAAATSASGLDLTWNACNLPLSAGASVVDFDCSDPGFVRNLFGNFQSPVSIPDLVALDAVLDIETGASSLPDFWHYGPAGCNADGLILSDAMPAACPGADNVNPWGLGGSAADAFITAYAPDYGGGGHARLLLSVFRASTNPASIAGGENVFGFELTWTGNLLPCAGCATPAEITWTSAQLHSAGTMPPVTVSGTGRRSSVVGVNGGLSGLGLTSVVPNRISDRFARVQVFGRDLVGITDLSLTYPGRPTIPGSGIVVDAAGRSAWVSFDLTGALSGLWTLRATRGATTVELVQAVRLIWAIPEVTVISPAAGDQLLVNRIHEVLWEAVDDHSVTTVDFYISLNGGAIWLLVATGLPNTGSAAFRFRDETNNGYFRVVAHDADGNTGAGESGPFIVTVGPVSTLISRFEAVRAQEGTLVSWSFGTPERVSRAELDRARSEAGPWTPVQAVHRTDGGVTTVLDTDPEAATSRYRLRALMRDGNMVTFGPIAVSSGAVAVASGIAAIAPNPATTRVRIEFTVAREAPVRLSVLDVQGREVAVLADGVLPAGRHNLAWDARAAGRALPPGLYLVRFVDPTRRHVTRLALTR